MTAGQRNSYIAIGELIRNYSLDDVLFALAVVVAEESRDADGSDYRKALLSASTKIDALRASLSMETPT